MKRLTAAIMLGYWQHCASTLQQLQQLATVQQLQDRLKELNGDGILASIAAKLALDLDSRVAKPATRFQGFRKDSKTGKPYHVRMSAEHAQEGRQGSGTESKYHAEPGLVHQLRSAATVDQLRALLRQLRDDGTLKRLAQMPPGQGAATVAAGAPEQQERAAESVPEAAVVPQQGRGTNAAESPVGVQLSALVPTQAPFTKTAAGTKRRRSQGTAAALGAMLTTGVLAQEAAFDKPDASDSSEAERPHRVKGRHAGQRLATPAASPLNGFPWWHEQQQERQKQQPEQEQAPEPQQQREQQRQQRGHEHEPQQEAAGAARSPGLTCSPSATSDDDVIIVSETPGLACRRAASSPSPEHTAAAGLRQCVPAVALKQEALDTTAMGRVGCNWPAGYRAKVGAARATLVAKEKGFDPAAGMPTGPLPPADLPLQPLLPSPQLLQQQRQQKQSQAREGQQQQRRRRPQHNPQVQQQQDREPASKQNAGAYQPPPASEPAAAAAGPSLTKLATLLSGCCDSPQAAAMGLTPKLVGAFLVAYSRHFTALQKQEAALLVEALLAGGQLEAVKGYLEGTIPV
ncbi:hypothetical protein N2152v2_004069 [Parachlorella kessleri]